MPLEIEIKFLLHDPPALRKRLERLGARSSGRHFESNLRFDDNRRSLLDAGTLLRLRADRRCRLTFKSPAGKSGEEFKVYRELEVEVSDFDETAEILQALGFVPVQRYEKWRETFHIDGTEFCLDTLPFGDFLEIEGQKGAIRRYAGSLGFDWKRRILDNYLHIFDLLRRRGKLPFSDVTFENFKNSRIEPSALASLLEGQTP